MVAPVSLPAATAAVRVGSTRLLYRGASWRRHGLAGPRLEPHGRRRQGQPLGFALVATYRTQRAPRAGQPWPPPALLEGAGDVLQDPRVASGGGAPEGVGQGV